MIDAFKRASAGRITAVVPYYAYGRSDKKDQPRVPITARLIADMITVAGADRMLTMDLHQGQIQGFFNIPVDELTAVHMLSRYFIDKHLEECVVVTDLGFAKRARAFAEILDAPLAIVEKRRHGNLDRAEVINVIGEVHGRRAIIVDDEVDTAGTLIETVRALEREGVTEIYACATHGVLSDPAVERIANSEPARGGHHRQRPAPAVQAAAADQVLSVAPLIGEAIKRIHRGESVGALFRPRCRSPRRCSCGRTGRAVASAPIGTARGRRATTTYHHRCPHRPAPDRSHRRPMSLQLHRPDGKGGLEPRAVTDENWHNQLRSPRWGASLKGGKLPKLANPEMNPTSTRAVGRVLGRARADHVRDHRRRLRQQLLHVSAGAHGGAGRDRRARHRRPGGELADRGSAEGTRSRRHRPGATMQRVLIVSGVLGLGHGPRVRRRGARPRRCSPTARPCPPA